MKGKCQAENSIFTLLPRTYRYNISGIQVIIKKDNEAIDFIEVKGKVSNKPEFFEVTDMQFRFASEQGEKYFFYVVSNVKSKEIKIEIVIRDPIKEWRENRLIASPIKFKI